MQIKTIAEILAENNITDNAKDNGKCDNSKPKPSKEPLTAEFFAGKQPTHTLHQSTDYSKNKPSYKSTYKKLNNTHKKRTSSKPQYLEKTKHKKVIQKTDTRLTTTQFRDTKTIVAPKSLNIKAILQEVRDENTNNQGLTQEYKTHDNLTSKLQAGLKTPEQRQAEKDAIKANSRLRWLAFYYLSTREHSANELKKKLLAKDQDPDKINQLLTEFAKKGYQSEMRTALMLIREGIRKGRGHRRIEQDFYQRKVDLPSNIDELIDMANEESDEFADFIHNDPNKKNNEQVDWLRLAVEARVKKYGASIPIEIKEKAKQLRFLQYRGFTTNICFKALQHNLKTLDDYYY